MTSATDTAALQARIAELESMVAAQAQEPVAWLCGGNSFTDYAKAVGFAQANMRSISNLYAAPPAPASLSLVQAALEAAATECNRMKMFPGGRQESYAHHGVDAAAKAIRAIDPQTIIEGVGK